MIPYGRQNIIDDDISAVLEVLRSDWLTQGPTVPKFEEIVADKTQAQYAVAMNSATSVLHAACLALELGPGDWLWTVPNTFVASANCGRLCGASIDFVDIDPRTYCMDPNALERKLQTAEKENRIPKILVPVHYAGQSSNMEEISTLAAQYGIKVIEDASHAVGATYLHSPVGSCQYGDIAVFSFHPVKIITTAEGGIATTNDASLAAKMRRIRTNGITRVPEEMLNADCEPWMYEQLEIGLNYRMTDMQAALGVSQMSRLDAFISRRRELAQRYDEMLSDMPVIRPWQSPHGMSAYHLYPILIDTERSVQDRLSVFSELRNAGIGVNVHYIPVHTQPYYRSFGFKFGDFPVSEWFYSREISLPMFYALTFKQQRFVVDCVRSAIEKCAAR